VSELWHVWQVRPFPPKVSVVKRRWSFSFTLVWACEPENAAASTRIVIVALIAF
jgi:hypothetical protein